jgi:hypothetical protein
VAGRAFDSHVFISYAHIDNQPLTPDQQGWVSRFHASLEAMLSMRIGRKAEIWRDRKLTGNDIFADEIVAQFPRTALMICVLTPRYVGSDWCTREVREFCRAAERSGGVIVDNKSRIVKVIKTPVDTQGPLPPPVVDTLGYQFYIFDEEQTPLELDPAFGPDMAQKFNLKLAKLAWDIAQQLKVFAAPAPVAASAPAPGPEKPTVYLAECSWDQREVREALEAELRLHGYPVVPDRRLPAGEADYVAEVARLLEQSQLSIHLIGTSYGAVPDGPAEKSVVMLQNEIAIDRCKSAPLRRVLWLPHGTASRNPEQQRFIDRLQRDPDAQFGADVIAGDIEALKTSLHATLDALVQPKPAPETPSDQARLVYLICDAKDRDATRPLRKFLRGEGVDVQLPVFEGDAATVRQSHEDLLRRCDAVIVFYGAGGESWKRAVDTALRKASGQRGGRPLAAICTYIAEPATADKNDLVEMDEPFLMNGLSGFAGATAAPLIRRLQRA